MRLPWGAPALRPRPAKHDLSAVTRGAVLPCTAEDCQRYEEQQGYIQAICTLYETAPQDYPQLVELLQQASCGCRRN